MLPLAYLALALAGAPAAPSSTEAEEALRFGTALMDAGDYYRAISEFKRVGYLQPGSPEAFACSLAIGRAYEKAGRAPGAAVWLEHLQYETTTPQLRADLLVEMAYARYLAGSAPTAVDDLARFLDDPQVSGSASRDTRQRARYLLGWAEVSSNLLPQAAETFRAVDLPYASALADRVLEGTRRPYRSKLLAGVLSAVVPGLGHVYVGQPLIGLAAFGWNGLFGFATWDAFDHRLWGVGAALGGLDLLWYGASLIGAISAAEEFNRSVESQFLDDLKSHYDVAPTSWPPSGGAAPTPAR
jgi:hypothetical protein